MKLPNDKLKLRKERNKDRSPSQYLSPSLTPMLSPSPSPSPSPSQKEIQKTERLGLVKELETLAQNEDLEGFLHIVDMNPEIGNFIDCVHPNVLDQILHYGDYHLAARLMRADSDFRHYEKTGEIGDNLLPFFDQDGHWYGLGLNWSDFGKIENEAIDKKRTIFQDNGGSIHLLSSYITNDTKNVELKYKTFSGDVVARDAASLQLPYTTRVCGDMICNGKVLEIPELTEAGGHINHPAVEDFQAPRLIYIAGDLELLMATKISLPQLRHCLGNIKAQNVIDSLELPNLIKTRRDLDARRVKKILAQKVSEIGGDFIASEAQEILCPKLLKIEGSLLIHNLTNPKLLGLPSLRVVKDSIEIPSDAFENPKHTKHSKHPNPSRHKTLGAYGDDTDKPLNSKNPLQAFSIDQLKKLYKSSLDQRSKDLLEATLRAQTHKAQAIRKSQGMEVELA